MAIPSALSLPTANRGLPCVHSLLSALGLTLGKEGLCRVPDVLHSAKKGFPVVYTPWVTFERHCTREVQGCSSSIADKNTQASCRTTGGHPISVSLCLAVPPEGSRVCVQLPAGLEVSYAVVLAAHGDSVLVQVAGINNRGTNKSNDHFVYSAGDAAAKPPRPPSLSLLAPHSITNDKHKHRACYYLDKDSTGLLRRGDGDDFLVAELNMEYVMERDPSDELRKDAALHLLRSGPREWCVRRPVIRRYADGVECVNLASLWRNSIIIPVGDQMLCWVDLARGLLFSDGLFDESPSLRYVPLPVDPNFHHPSYRNVCVTGNGSTIKFVNVFPRCCCGGAGRSYCHASHHAYTVHTWTLRMDDGMAWAMDGTIDATQLWSLDGYKGLPRVELDYPVVSMDESDAICFVVCEDHHEKHGDETAWRVMVDMKSKTLGSVFQYPKERRWSSRDHLIPSRVSKYFNSKPSSGQLDSAAAQAEAMQNLTNRKVNNKLQAINNTMQVASPETAIFAALQEIPSLDRDDMLKAYSILAHDDSGRRLRVLMGLPMDWKKDFVLMEIKASEACVLCSACSADLQLKE